MCPLVVLVTSAALGIEVGWEPLAGGGHQYTIQIEPQLLDVLKRGKEEIFSEVPPEIDVRRYRITVGTGTLARDAGDPPAKPDRDPQPPPEKADPFDVAPVESAPPPVESASPPPQSAEPGPTPAETPPSFPTGRDPSDDNARFVPDAPREARNEQPPAKLPADGDASGPIQTTFDARPSDDAADSAAREAQKPTLPKEAGKPWFVLVASVVLLCCSLGANLYLGWIAWDARTRYRDAVAKLRTAS
ncbi:MAG: hypothetical protein WDZ48_03125 [Pirellulales bacterium]